VEQVRCESFKYLQQGIADITVATVRLTGGVSAHIYLSWLSPLTVASVVVVGSQGMLHYEGRFGNRALRFFRYEVANPDTVTDNVVPIPTFDATETVAGGPEEPLMFAAQAFVTSVHTGVPAPSAGRYSQRVVELLEAGAQSA
jgi:predicted dehydrogenase